MTHDFIRIGLHVVNLNEVASATVGANSTTIELRNGDAVILTDDDHAAFRYFTEHSDGMFRDLRKNYEQARGRQIA